MNNKIAKFIFKAGAKRRNPELFAVAEKLKQSDFYTQEQYRDIQREKLTDLFAFAGKYAPFYKDSLGNFKDQDPFEVLGQMPIMAKMDLAKHHDALQCYSQFNRLFAAETSGSTGQPFRFKKDVGWDTLNRASIIRSYWWFDVQPWEKNGYFWGYNFESGQVVKTKILDGLQNRFRAFQFDKTELKSFLKKLKHASYLHGYSSVIYEVAQIALALGFSPKDFPKLKLVKGTSEKIYDYYHEPVKAAFGHKIVSEYGAAETGIIAFECPHGNMHINEENVIVEEENGEAIITNLNARSLPVIRYKLGDSIALSAEKCTCGRHSRIVDEVVGRVGKKIVGKTKHFPSLTLYYIFKNIALKNGVDIQYQGVQHEAGKLELKTRKVLSVVERDWIETEWKKYFGKDLDMDLKENIEIHDKKGKLKDFITHL